MPVEEPVEEPVVNEPVDEGAVNQEPVSGETAKGLQGSGSTAPIFLLLSLSLLLCRKRLTHNGKSSLKS